MTAIGNSLMKSHISQKFIKRF